jgi:hypothetical protein
MLIDSRGNLFGRFNLVDVAAVLFAVILVPMGYVAYRVFRIPQPEILSATPGTLTPETPRRVRLAGRHFRPYLGAFVSKTGEPFGLLPVDAMQATFLVVTPNDVEIALPANIGTGTYDVRLYDEAQEVATLKAAFTLAPLPGVTVEAVVRFAVPPGAVSLIAEGDRDRWEQAGSSALTPSEFATMGPMHVTRDQVTLVTPRAQLPGVAVEATVRIPAKTRTLGGWEYKGEWIRAGEMLLFETNRYRIFGVIDRMTEIPATPPAASGGK